MTDRQIVAAYLANILFNASCAPNHDTLRELSETNLSEQRCSRVIGMIIEECDRLRARYVNRLNRAGHDTI
jgi:hypothetical protein